jgi:hypothetical protein
MREVKREGSPMVALRRAASLASAVIAAGLAMACSTVLGLDAPKLDPCAEVACNDAAIDGADASDARADAATDSSVVGLRCGGGSFGVTGCSAASPTCCQLTSGAGTTYECRASATACTGYPIECASNEDCSGNGVCCHSATQIRCVGATACADDSLVCEPGGRTDQCPTGWKCTGTLTNAGIASPYFACAP